MERAGMYDDLFAISPGMRTSMAEYIMAKALGAVPPALGSATADQKDMILKDVAALRETAELYADTNSVHYRHTLYLARLHLLEFVLEPDKDKRAELLATVQKLEMTLEDLSPKNPQNNWVKAQRELFLGETLEALQTLQMADEYAPGIVSTKDKIEQVEAFLSGEGNIPFFTD